MVGVVVGPRLGPRPAWGRGRVVVGVVVGAEIRAGLGPRLGQDWGRDLGRIGAETSVGFTSAGQGFRSGN